MANLGIDAGYEDGKNPEVYAKIIDYLTHGAKSDVGHEEVG